MAKNDGGVNFIRHLLSISEKFIDDQRLSPLHISLYYALFQSWNLSKFRNPISISRDELMRASKIGSANTYTKCLKELDIWGYLKYHPSHNPYKGSQIYLYNFNKTTDNGIDISSDKSFNKTGGKTPEKVVIPSLNSTNNTNKSNSLNEHESKRKKNSRKFIAADGNGSKEKKIAQKKEKSETFTSTNKRKSAGRQNHPSLLQVKKYFAGRTWPDIEAEKFYNYFQSNGWLVGGKTAMKDWKAAANNWMLNAESFTKNGSDRKPFAGKLHTSTAKDYTEPL